VATVSSAGVVTGVKAGTATITVTTSDGKFTATCAVTVGPPVTGVKLNRTTAPILTGKTLALTATIAPANAAWPAVTWASSNTAVATVSGAGVVKGREGGYRHHYGDHIGRQVYGYLHGDRKPAMIVTFASTSAANKTVT